MPARERLGAVRARTRLVALALQRGLQAVAERRVVFGEKDEWHG